MTWIFIIIEGCTVTSSITSPRTGWTSPQTPTALVMEESCMSALCCNHCNWCLLIQLMEAPLSTKLLMGVFCSLASTKFLSMAAVNCISGVPWVKQESWEHLFFWQYHPWETFLCPMTDFSFLELVWNYKRVVSIMEAELDWNLHFIYISLSN